MKPTTGIVLAILTVVSVFESTSGIENELLPDQQLVQETKGEDYKSYHQPNDEDTDEFDFEHPTDRRHAELTDDVDVDDDNDQSNYIDNDVNYKFWKIVTTIFA